MRFAIVAVGYNRPASMYRLIESVQQADYQGDTVDLVISLDKGARQDELIEIAQNTVWSHGEKIIRAFSERQGLKSHILQCGSLTEQYDAIVVLEDDLIVSPGFYSYCKQMINYYDCDDKIAGISLYKHRINPGVHKPFEPEDCPFDVYFMQVAQSWGQCWTSRMWSGFIKWYGSNNGEVIADKSFPKYISNWNEASWLKYYNKYVVDNDLYYVYPYKSLTTNHTDVGEHSAISNNDYQVPLLNHSMEYKCCPLSDGVRYDIFFERVGIESEYLSQYNGVILLDLMGTRHCFDGADFLISTQCLPYKVVDELQLRYRPLEMNIILSKKGEGIYVYDLHEISRKPKCNSHIVNAYDIRGMEWTRALSFGLYGCVSTIKRKIVKAWKKTKVFFYIKKH